MERQPMRRKSLTAGVVALGVLLGTGCVESGSGLIIVQNQLPTVDMGVCEIPGTKTMVTRPYGRFDVALDGGYPYFLYPLVENNLPPFEVNGIEQNRIDLETFQLKIEPPSGISVAWSAECPQSFSFPGRKVLFPGESHGMITQAMKPGCSAGPPVARFGRLRRGPSPPVRRSCPR